MDNSALFKIGYGLYVLTAKDAGKDSGCIINTVLQVTSVPPFVGLITVNKQNYTHELIMNSRQFNISILTTDAPFEIFKHFGFQSGRDVDKFSGYDGASRSENGLLYLNKHTNAYLSFNVKDTIDFGTHTLFSADIIEGVVLNDIDSVTYTYYQRHIKPRPEAAGSAQKKGWRCKICSYVYEGDPMPTDFICPICKHGVSDFERV